MAVSSSCGLGVRALRLLFEHELLVFRVFLHLDVVGELTLLEALGLGELSVSGLFDMILDLGELLGRVGMAEESIERAHVSLEHIFNGGELVTIR